ncbi:uncharacterized protein LOC135207320 [Macrobrachium nipponense]|uniref:uncharacterized protein LOC135207320 n=1 Tax=Macrobrachium nipponense TaxID=159736 RepID=UPI0030C85035
MNVEVICIQLFLVLIYTSTYQCMWIPDENTNYMYVKDKPGGNYSPRILEDTNISYDNFNSNMDNWSIDEEYIINPTKKTSLKQVLNNLGDQWWRITNPDDPARNAEPAMWDGHGLQKSIVQNLSADYQLVQDKWEEEAVT